MADSPTGITSDWAKMLGMIWLLSCLGSCLILVFSQRDFFRSIEFAEAIIAACAMLMLCIMGPFGLALLLTAALIKFLGSFL